MNDYLAIFWRMVTKLNSTLAQERKDIELNRLKIYGKKVSFNINK